MSLKNLNDYDKIIICHYGKVASNTLEKSLVNILNCDYAKIKYIFNYKEKILVTYNYYDAINHIIQNNEKILIISICRNLINRNVSMYFQINGDKIVDGETPSDEIIDKFNKIKFNDFKECEKYYTDIPQKLNLNFNIYQKLNADNYLFLQDKKVDFLLIRFENINEWKNIFEKVFGIENFVLVNKNLSENKIYNDLYKKTLLNTHNDFNIGQFKKTKHYKFFYDNS